MNGFINRILFSIASLNIFRRRYFIYQDTRTDLFYIRTRKLFFLPKYISVDGMGDLTQYYLKRKAIKYCQHQSKNDAIRTITQYKRNYTKQPKLRYIRIWE